MTKRNCSQNGVRILAILHLKNYNYASKRSDTESVWIIN